VSTNVYHLQLQLPAATADQREPLVEAVREVSGRLVTNNDERRRYYSRLDELKSADPSLRRSRTRSLPIDPQRPLTIFSFEEAAAPAPLREASGR
jgi:hypothetical protein